MLQQKYNFGVTGGLIRSELRMILRSPRLRLQVVLMGILVVAAFFYMLYAPSGILSLMPFLFFPYGIFVVGFMGIAMGQCFFMVESSFFDESAARKIALFEVLKSKYILYRSYSLAVTLLLLIPAFHGKISVFMLLSLFFYTTGVVYFLIFQHLNL
ncbi:MAG: DUF5687 family protein [Dysgonamonadaceae bacterium]|jgi:hypothetical protein|nr:DUF5687 family protein [Dysgonamonadaceae bacterium]